MSDLSPMLHQEQSNAPMLGGERAFVPLCHGCGEQQIRDFFGNVVCPACVENNRKLAALRETPVCPVCGHDDMLGADLETDSRPEPRIVGVYCDECENYVWIHPRDSGDYDSVAYLEYHGAMGPIEHL
jgi:hypothetical protein